MKIRTPTEFIVFDGGLCDIYSVKNNKRDTKKMTLCFGDRTIGYKRHFAASAASTEIDRLIHVPKQLSITTTDRVVICGEEYKIEQIQQLNDTNPPVSVLTLKKTG